MYDVFNSRNIIPKSQLKWNVVFEYTRLNLNVMYSIPRVFCHDTKLHWFQCRILHRIITTNDSLTKMHIRQNNVIMKLKKKKNRASILAVQDCE